MIYVLACPDEGDMEEVFIASSILALRFKIIEVYCKEAVDSFDRWKKRAEQFKNAKESTYTEDLEYYIEGMFSLLDLFVEEKIWQPGLHLLDPAGADWHNRYLYVFDEWNDNANYYPPHDWHSSTYDPAE